MKFTVRDPLGAACVPPNYRTNSARLRPPLLPTRLDLRPPRRLRERALVCTLCAALDNKGAMQDKPPASPEPLILPRGIRFPQPHEFPPGTEAEQTRIDRAQVTTGYRLLPNTGGGYAAYIEANAHAINLFAVFYDLALTLLPRVAAPIIAIQGADTYTGPYTIRAAALRLFEPHIQALQHDGFLAFGLICQRDGVTDQVFVQPSKHLQIWTNQPVVARAVLAQHRIPEVPDLQVMDQYLLVREPFQTQEGAAAWPLVLEHVRAAFTTLPPPER